MNSFLLELEANNSKEGVIEVGTQEEQRINFNQRISPVQRLVGTSKAVQEARDFAERVAESDLTVLLIGETGVGKDHLAELIHQVGRPGKPFVVVDCGALTESLSETELFGHARGAFTDAREEKVGLVQAAQDGTLFFNEVANMSLGLQAKFLRILDKKPFRPVGGRVEVQVRARIIAATNAKLEEMVRARTFRLDLFHRLNVLSFYIAPLRRRKEDIPELISFCLNGSADRFSPDALALLMEYNWPGNVRELMNVVQRAAFMTKDEKIDIEQIRSYFPGLKDNIPEDEYSIVYDGPTGTRTLPTFNDFKELERRYLCDVLEACGGNTNRACILSGIGHRTMNYKILKFGLKDFIDRLRKENL